MPYAYIALVVDESHSNYRLASAAGTALREMDMQEVLSGRISLYCSRETPIHHFSGGGILIGDVFHRTGAPLAAGASFPLLPSGAEARKYLTENYWGDYLFIQPPTESERDWTVMRDPSGALACVYSLGRQGHGFITSDVSLATRSGIYQRQVDWSYVPHCLTYPYAKAGRTGLAEINELLPGCSLRFHETNVVVEQQWSPWDFVARKERYSDPSEAAVEIRNAIATVVNAWAGPRESILLELSGGLDSSIVAASLRDTGAAVTCCTLVTPVPGADERTYARLMADYLGVELRSRELTFESARFDFPLASDSVNPSVAALQYAVNEQMEAAGELYGATSFYSGGGGDTVFCYLNGATPAVDALQERGLLAGLSAIRDLAELHRCTFWRAARLTLRKMQHGPRPPHKPDSSFLGPAGVAPAGDVHPWMSAPDRALPGDRERIVDLAGTQIFRDGIPRNGKRRFRMPLLSQPVMEACLRAPSWMWIAGGRNRIVARTAFSDLLPEQVAQRRSKGSFMNYYGAVYRRNKLRMRDYLLTGGLHANHLLDANALKQFFQKDPGPRDESFTRIFELCMVENWVRRQR